MIRDKNGRDAKGFAELAFHNESRAGRIPGSITTRFKSGADTSGGKTAGIGFSLNKLIA